MNMENCSDRGCLWPVLALILLGAAIIFAPHIANAQTITDPLGKARDEVNQVENGANRTVYHCSRGNEARCLEEARSTARAASRALYAVDLAISREDPNPMPDPAPGEDGGLVEPISTEVAGNLITGRPKPGSGAPDPVGAFRTFCDTSHFARVDPIVFPGQQDAGHLHRFMGNTLTDHNSDYGSLRTSGDSSCYGGALYRTAIWAPVLFDQDGLVVRPDYTTLYYKRYPQGSDKCTEVGISCVDLPVGLEIIYGTNYSVGQNQSPNVRFDCNGRNLSQTIAEALIDCQAGEFFRASIRGPDCWDGKRASSPDHQSHLAYTARDPSSGQARCPDSHPYVIPTVTYIEVTTLQPGDRGVDFAYSSDIMNGLPGGRTFHGDYFEAIEPAIRDKFHRFCIDELLSCVSGDLGDGTKLGRPAGFTFDPKPRLTVEQALAYRSQS